MRKLHFNWNVKEKPEDFIVKEVSQLELDNNGRYHLYLLIKRNMNTRDIASRFNLGYAGLKDKNALTFQYVSSERFLGETLFEKGPDGSFFGLIHKGKIARKIKIGQLKGNRFSVRLKGHNVKIKDWLVNYYDLQRISRNSQKGKKIIKDIPPGVSWKDLSWLENFYIDAYLSYLWNKALTKMLMEIFSGYFVYEKGKGYFIPDTTYEQLFNSFPKFLPILGYKVKLSPEERSVYQYVLQREGISVDEMVDKLRGLKIKGDYRKTFLKVENISLTGNRIEFFLPKGAYGTIYLKTIYQG